MIDQKEMKNSRFSVKKFFFPFSPIKSFRSVRLLFLMAILIALRIVFGLLTIRIAPFVLSISIAWVPLMVLGWYFGPVVGLILGILTDTISFLMAGGGIWFWMYAIQEPIIGLISGLIAGLCRYRKDKIKRSISFDIVLSQIVVIVFAVISYVTLIVWVNSIEFEGYKPEYEKFYEIYRWVVVGCVSLLIVVYEILIILTMTKKIGKTEHHVMINFIYSSSLVIVSMLVFSVALGPITAVEYAKFAGLDIPEGYAQFGSLFYLVPRVCVEAIKVPVEASCLFGVVCLFDKKVMNIVNKINNTWEAA
ncbi:MAG: ECF transporter S component [Mycoplasma sp.]|nr:ECF transporter S component [Candidatus Hennigella equi]